MCWVLTTIQCLRIYTHLCLSLATTHTHTHTHTHTTHTLSHVYVFIEGQFVCDGGCAFPQWRVIFTRWSRAHSQSAIAAIFLQRPRCSICAYPVSHIDVYIYIYRCLCNVCNIKCASCIRYAYRVFYIYRFICVLEFIVVWWSTGVFFSISTSIFEWWVCFVYKLFCTSVSVYQVGCCYHGGAPQSQGPSFYIFYAVYDASIYLYYLVKRSLCDRTTEDSYS